MTTSHETVLPDISTTVDPRLAGMAAAYGLEVTIDEDAISQAIPHLLLPGTDTGALKFTAKLRREAVFKDVYWLQRTVAEDDSRGADLTVYYSQKDVKRQRAHQEIVLPAIKEALNTDNDSLRRVVRKYNGRRINEAALKTLASIAIPTAAAVFGAHEINGVSPDIQETLEIVGGLGALAVSGLATLRYGVYLGQRAELRRSPYQQQGEPIPKDLPQVVHFQLIAHNTAK